MTDTAALPPPPRLYLPQVLELAGYGRSTLWQRQRTGMMPKTIDRVPSGGTYKRDAVLTARRLSARRSRPCAWSWIGPSRRDGATTIRPRASA